MKPTVSTKISHRQRLDKIDRLVNEAHRLLSDLIYDEKRGQWGTDAEAAMSAAEADLIDFGDQIEMIRKLRLGT